MNRRSWFVLVPLVLAVLVACEPIKVGPPAPVVPPRSAITSLVQRAGPVAGANTVTINGTNFTGATKVMFGTKAATSFKVVSAKKITAKVPAVTSARTVSVRVTTAGGTSNNTSRDDYAYAPVPTATQVDPVFGPAAGGNSVTIAGTGFQGGLFSTTAVSFGSTPATSFTVNSATQITATAPEGIAGSVNVRVTTPGGITADTIADNYLYVPLVPVLPVPTVTGLSPDTGPALGGNTVTITGTGFDALGAVTFGLLPAAFTFDGPTQITATAPPGVGVVDVRVTTLGGQSANTAADDYLYVAAPVVTSIAPTGGPLLGGNTVTITGSGFADALAVTFGVTPVLFTVDSNTQITATAPALGVGTVDVRVTTLGGTSANTAADNYTYVGAPTVTALSPAGGPLLGGNSVTITGTGFTGAVAVTFGLVPALPFTVDSATQITATAPIGVGTVDVVVTTLGGASGNTAADDYTYTAAPAVTSISPSSGPLLGLNAVTINGTNLGGALLVQFGLLPGIVTNNTANQITVTAPAGVGIVSVRVTTLGGISADTANDDYTYTLL